MASYISGNKVRLFVNTSLGCNSSCSYCYLPQLSLSVGRKVIHIQSAEKIIEEIISNQLLDTGKNGTLVSIGCYSECWDTMNREETKKLISYFLKLGNQIQLATKRCISIEDIGFVSDLIQWKGQLIIFTSCATISESSKYENGTPLPTSRFLNFSLSKYLNIPTCLYIKPVIKDVTINDCKKFGEIMLEYGVPVVVGGRFSDTRTMQIAPIGQEKLFYTSETDDQEKIIKHLQRLGTTYRFSTEFMEEWRKKY